MHDVGGNFGTRGGFNPEFAIVAWAARRIGRPVKWTCDAQRVLLSATTRRATWKPPPNWRSMRTVRFSRCAARTWSTMSAPTRSPSAPSTRASRSCRASTTCPRSIFRARAAMTNTAPTRPYRSSGRPEVMFVMERLIDLAARRRPASTASNCAGATSSPKQRCRTRNPFGMIYDSGAYHAVMERVLELADWDGFPARRTAAQGARHMPRHRRRQLCRYRDRRAAREGRNDRRCPKASSKW